jgi:hypothetical protein
MNPDDWTEVRAAKEDPTTYVRYKGYRIYPKPARAKLGATLKWTTRVEIFRDRGHSIAVKRFRASNLFPTQKTAWDACIQFGKQIIDGEIPRCSVDEI